MIYETCVILGNAYHIYGFKEKIENPYRPHYVNHPQCKWARESSENFSVLVSYLSYLILEFDRKGGSSTSWSRERQFCNQFGSFCPCPKGELTLPYLTFGNKDNPKIDSMYKEIQKFYGIWDEEKKVWTVDSWQTAITAYRHYYKLKLFKNDKLPVWEKDHSSKPTWYEHEETVFYPQNAALQPAAP